MITREEKEIIAALAGTKVYKAWSGKSEKTKAKAWHLPNDPTQGLNNLNSYSLCQWWLDSFSERLGSPTCKNCKKIAASRQRSASLRS
jgi:hypothetical protein